MKYFLFNLVFGVNSLRYLINIKIFPFNSFSLFLTVIFFHNLLLRGFLQYKSVVYSFCKLTFDASLIINLLSDFIKSFRFEEYLKLIYFSRLWAILLDIIYFKVNPLDYLNIFYRYKLEGFWSMTNRWPLVFIVWESLLCDAAISFNNLYC